MAYVLVLYYSRNGSTEALANKIAAGVEMAGLEAKIRTVAPISDNLNNQAASIPQQGAPYVSLDELRHCQGLALGSPTRFGNMASAMKYFWDSTSELWLSGALINKPACVFTSTSTMHGGQESTLLSMQLPLLHHGMVILGLPYSEAALNRTSTGGTPYGVSHLASEQNNKLSDHEQQLCLAQGKRLAQLAKRLSVND